MEQDEKKIKNVISISDLSPYQLFEVILPLCRKEMPFAEKKEALIPSSRKKVQMLFLEPSTRTRGSNAEAVQLLGLRHDSVIGAEASALTKKETLGNMARMFAEYGASALIVRTSIEGAPKFMAELLEKNGYQCAVHNAGDGTNQHPTQTVLDLLAIDMHLGRFDDFTIGFFGDLRYGRTIHSLLTALSYRKNIKVVLVQTPETALGEKYLKLFPGNVKIADSMEALVDHKVDVVYGGRIQEERFKIDKLTLARLRKLFTVTPGLLSALKKAVVMHPMPYVQEFPLNVRNDPKIIIDDQAWCGIPTRVALFKLSLANLGVKEFEEVESDVVLDVVECISTSEYVEQRRKRKEADLFMPIKNGTVIDHIPKRIGTKIKQLLQSRDQLACEGPVMLINRIYEGKSNGKEMLILCNNFVDDKLKMSIVSLAPTVTFNEITSDHFRKIRAKTPSKIRGIGTCPNDVCITNNDPEAEATFVHSSEGLKCWYCENEFRRDQVI